MRVLCFGDSIVQGFWDTQGGWAQRLRSHYDELQLQNIDSDQPTIFNLGISGETSAGLVERFKRETQIRNDQPLSFIFGIGTNDTIYRGDEYQSTPEEYTKNLLTLVNQAREFTNRIAFVGMGPVVDELVQPMRWSSSGKCYSTERIWLFEKGLRNLCQEQNLMHIAVFEALSKEKEQGREVFADGAHPNNEGHQIIFDLVKPALEEVLKV